MPSETSIAASQMALRAKSERLKLDSEKLLRQYKILANKFEQLTVIRARMKAQFIANA